ncbi:MAG: NAD(P)/FAD-dependent oxidoreductase [Bacteroidia bacterium]|nr:NAD(P)/FAD-dependent oxidoreductase [Bacteroidia bacterium]
MDAEVIVIGSGIAGLTVAALIAGEGKKVKILEKNWLPGGCSSSYPRKHFVFESGATTLVGLDENMPLDYLLRKTGIKIPAIPLSLPMQVYLKNGQCIHRFQSLEAWIQEAERVFGKKNQKVFWEKCFQISKAVWETSLQQLHFPPSDIRDLFMMVKGFRWNQLRSLPFAFTTVAEFLKKYELDTNTDLVDFVNEQLMITAQNTMEEVNMLFGATALCYTNFGNYYLNGGMIEMVNPIMNYIQDRGGEILLRTGVEKVRRNQDYFEIHTSQQVFHTPQVVFAIPVNNVLEIWDEPEILQRYSPRLLPSEKLNSAFTIGAVFKRKKNFESLHHQIHLSKPLSFTGSSSIFVSISHHEDTMRCKPDEVVINISTHIPDPEKTWVEDKEEVVAEIFSVLEEKGMFLKEDLIFYHASTPKSWAKWTSRKWGFVGGYPQYKAIKPWQMISARMVKNKAYLCGDSTYPGQGIPGACLSGIIAFEKWKSDGKG